MFKYRRLWLLALVLAGLSITLSLLPVTDWLQLSLVWAQTHTAYAWLIFIMLYMLAAVCMFPAVLLTLSAGIMFGVLAGTVLVSVASLLGAVLVFAVGRTVARAQVRRLVSRTDKFIALERAIRSKGFWMVLLIRLSPLFPYVVQNYLFSVSSISWRDYTVATWLGMLPGIVLYTSIGAAATNLAAIFSGQAVAGTAGKALFVAGVVITLVIILVITRVAGKALQEEITDG